MWFLGFSNHEKGAPRQEILKCSTVCSTFLRSGWSIVEVHRLAREVLKKRDHHHTSTKFWFGVMRWVHELCKRPLKISFNRAHNFWPICVLFSSFCSHTLVKPGENYTFTRFLSLRSLTFATKWWYLGTLAKNVVFWNNKTILQCL
jgi:hypothetical protein